VPISAVLLDVGGVLLVPHPEPVTRALTAAQIAVGHFDPERAHAVGVAAIDGITSPEDFKPGYLRAFVNAAGVRPQDQTRAVHTLIDLWARPAIDIWRHVIGGSIEGMRLLADQGMPLALVSNADGTVEEQMHTHRICQVGTGPGVSVCAIVDSAIIGVEKPDPRTFAPAIAAVGCRPEDIAYVGDTVCYDVLGARNAGLVPIHFDPFGLCGGWDEHRHVRSLAELAGSPPL
jgi:putative hydrolase of the HAD superfamily